jgi:hypothetical protein
MAKRTTKQQDHSWAVYHIRGTPARLAGIVDAPDEESAIKQAIEEYKGAGKPAQPADRAAAGLSNQPRPQKKALAPFHVSGPFCTGKTCSAHGCDEQN